MKHTFILIIVLLLNLFSFQVKTASAITVANSLCHENTASIGESYTGVIKVVNSERTPIGVKIYQTDYLYHSDGSNQFGEPGKASRSNAGWIEQPPQHITIPPKSTSMVHYTVNIPKKNSLSGSYWSMIMIQKVDEKDLELFSSGERQLGIRQLTRYAVQVITHIEGTGSRQLEFRTLKLLKNKNKRILRVDMENSGTRALRPRLWVDFYSEDGGFKKKINGNQRRIFPECSIMEQLDLSDIPPGDYKAIVVADAGEETVFGTSFSIQLEK